MTSTPKKKPCYWLGWFLFLMIGFSVRMMAQEIQEKDSTELDQLKVNEMHGQLYIQRRFNLIRYLDKFGYLLDIDKINSWEKLKYIPLDKNRKTFLSFGGDSRSQLEFLSSDGFGTQETIDDYRWNQRLMLHTAVRNKHFGVFAQLISAHQVGNELLSAPVDEEDLDVHQLFLLLKRDLENEGLRFRVRLGRQELFYGSGRHFAIREGPNVRLSYDGGSADLLLGNITARLFYLHEVPISDGMFNNEWFGDNILYGTYNSWQTNHKDHIFLSDLYYARLERPVSFYQDLPLEDERHTLGVRQVVRSTGRKGMDFSVEANYQFGHVDGVDIRAYSISADADYFWKTNETLHRAGVSFNLFSGDGQPNDGEASTFNPINPAIGFLGRLPILNFSNLVVLQPSYRLSFDNGLALFLQYSWLWRHRLEDTIYTPGARPFLGEAFDNQERFLAMLPSLEVEWTVNAFVSFEVFYSALLKEGYFNEEEDDIQNLVFTTYLRF